MFPSDELLWRLSVKQYHEMIRNGIFTKEDRVELIEGLLVARARKTPRHCLMKEMLRAFLKKRLPAGWHVESVGAITLEDGEPEPDLSVVRGDTRDYATRHPGPEDVALVIEVADASLSVDRGIKKRSYARAGIPVYWIVNLVEDRIEVHTQPGGFGQDADYRHGEVFEASKKVVVCIEGLEVGCVSLEDLFGGLT